MERSTAWQLHAIAKPDIHPRGPQFSRRKMSKQKRTIPQTFHYAELTVVIVESVGVNDRAVNYCLNNEWQYPNKTTHLTAYTPAARGLEPSGLFQQLANGGMQTHSDNTLNFKRETFQSKLGWSSDEMVTRIFQSKPGWSSHEMVTRDFSVGRRLDGRRVHMKWSRETIQSKPGSH